MFVVSVSNPAVVLPWVTKTAVEPKSAPLNDTETSTAVSSRSVDTPGASHVTFWVPESKLPWASYDWLTDTLNLHTQDRLSRASTFEARLTSTEVPPSDGTVAGETETASAGSW